MPILGPISLVDCVVFVICLIPQLFIQAGVLPTFQVVTKVLPFLGMTLPSNYKSIVLNMISISTSCPVLSRTVLPAWARSVAILSKRYLISRPRDSMCSICICLYTSIDRTSVLLQGSSPSFFQMEVITPWLPHMSCQVSWNQTSRLSRALDRYRAR